MDEALKEPDNIKRYDTGLFDNISYESLNIAKRVVIWEKAVSMVNPIIEKHGFKTYRLGDPFGNGSTFTEVDQHVEAILRVADWLINEENN